MESPKRSQIKINPRAKDVEVTWGSSHEASFNLVLEAQRRFLEITNDSRTSAALTLAWASLESRAG